MLERVPLYYQKKSYTCAVACLKTVSALMQQKAPDALLLERKLGTNEHIGTSAQRVVSWSRSHLPVETIGEDLWQGQLAVGLINFTKHERVPNDPHYVVFLGRLGRNVVTWCPFLASVDVTPEDHLFWHTRLEDRFYRRWSVNYARRLSTRTLARLATLHPPQHPCLPAA